MRLSHVLCWARNLFNTTYKVQPAALTPATAHSFRCVDTMLWTRLSRFTNTTCNKFLLRLHTEKKIKRDICIWRILHVCCKSGVVGKRTIWSEVMKCGYRHLSTKRPSISLIQSVSLCLTVNQHRCEQPACRQLNNQTLHQTCSALPSGDRRKWQQGERAMDAKKKVVERERTKESALALLSLGEGGWGSACLAIKYLFKGERLLTICLPMREQRQSFLPPLLFLQQRQRENISAIDVTAVLPSQLQGSGWLHIELRV